MRRYRRAAVYRFGNATRYTLTIGSHIPYNGGVVIDAPNYHITAMAKRGNMDDNTETIEEAAVETPQDATPEQDAGGTVPDTKGGDGDGDTALAARLDALEAQFAQLKVMFDTLGVGGPAVEPDGDADDDGVDDSIEALFEE